MGTLTRRELPGAGDSLAQLHDRQARGAAADVVGSLATTAVAAGQPVQERLKSGNALMLLAGSHLGFSLNKDGTRVQGQPGAGVGKLVTITGDAELEGIDFNRADVATALVEVKGTATVIFTNCRFIRSTADQADWVTVSAGCKAHFIGCFFLGVAAGGNVVNNAGAAANVGIIGCSNKTGRSHLNVTSIFETT